MKRILIWIAAGIFIAAGVAVAGGYYHGHGGSMFSESIGEMDVDKDGAVNFEEFNDAMVENNRAVFEALDRNGDGRIDAPEWNEFLRAHGVAVEG